MAINPNFTSTPRAAMAIVNTANTNRDGTGTIVNVFNAGTNGSRIETVEIVATGTTTANVIRLFLNDGTNTRLFDEILIPAVTPSTTTKVPRTTIVYNNPFVLPAGWSLRASTNNAQTYVIYAFGGDF